MSEEQQAKNLKLKAESKRLNTHCLYFLLFAFCFQLCSCSNSEKGNNNSSSPKFQQYYVQGEQLYLKNCSNCHQKEGTGLGRLYPPLQNSDFVKNNFNEVICIIKNGRTGELIVNGKSFNQPMPGFAALTDLEIAEIATYLYNSWGMEHGLIDVKEVSSILKTCSSP